MIIKRYLGNKNTAEVYDLDNEKIGCKINKIKKQYQKFFYPNTLKQAHKEKYDNCVSETLKNNFKKLYTKIISYDIIKL